MKESVLDLQLWRDFGLLRQQGHVAEACSQSTEGKNKVVDNFQRQPCFHQPGCTSWVSTAFRVTPRHNGITCLKHEPWAILQTQTTESQPSCSIQADIRTIILTDPTLWVFKGQSAKMQTLYVLCRCVCATARVWIRGEFSEVSSLQLLCGIQRLNPCHQPTCEYLYTLKHLHKSSKQTLNCQTLNRTTSNIQWKG